MPSNERDISYLNKIFYKKTRHGLIKKILREKYIRNDLDNGILHDNTLTADNLIELVKQSTLKHLLIIDTNIALHQIDLLEYQCLEFSLIVISQTVLSETKHLSPSIYRRLVTLINDHKRSYIFFANEQSVNTIVQRLGNETINDYNDRQIRKIACYFQGVISFCGTVFLLTNDNDNKVKACSENIKPYTIYEYIDKYLSKFPELFDLLANSPIPNSLLTQNQLFYNSYISLIELRNNIRTKQLHQGTLRVKSDWTDCYVVIQSRNKTERKSIIIEGKENVNRAIDGDVVVIEILPSKSKSNTSGSFIMGSDVDNTEAGIDISDDNSTKIFGKVVGILNRHWKSYAGSVDMSSISSAQLNDKDDVKMILFYPVNNRIPPVYISTKQIDKLIDNRILVTIDSWPENSLYPIGHYVKVLGKNGDKDVENLVLLHEYDIPSNVFSDAVLACLPPSSWRIETDSSFSSRIDLRNIPIVSIDPPGCKDIDDALHCILLDNGNYQAGVHIADVTHFVLPDTALDKEASYRSTSSYLVDRRIDMLPSLLSTGLCSLRCNEDHLAFSIIYEITKDFEIVNVEFFKTIIHSKASFSYQQAQDILDKHKAVSEENMKSIINPVELSVLLLNHLAKYFHNKRIQQGALTLASPEVKFNLDLETSNPIDISTYQLKESNALVEEWMLLANITVSKKILRHFPTLSVLRRHQPPTRQQFEPLVKAARIKGFNIDISSSKALADSLDLAVIPSDPYFNKLIRILSTRCMMPAQYICSGEIDRDGWYHYGLAAPIYTHFTSPIRRYADIIVHRCLAASIGVIPLPAALADRNRIQEQCTQMNRRHRAAQYVQRASVNLYTLLYFKNRTSHEKAYVLYITTEKTNILIPRYGIETFIDNSTIYPGNSKNEIIIISCNEELNILTVTSNNQIVLTVCIFDRINVLIQVKENNTGNRMLDVKLDLASNKIDVMKDEMTHIESIIADDDVVEDMHIKNDFAKDSYASEINVEESRSKNDAEEVSKKKRLLPLNAGNINSKRKKLRKYLK